MHKRFLRKSQVADRYQVHPRTVDRMVNDGRIDPPIYRGKFPLFDEELLEARERRAIVSLEQSA
jgi:hypothetical protein